MEGTTTHPFIDGTYQYKPPILGYPQLFVHCKPSSPTQLASRCQALGGCPIGDHQEEATRPKHARHLGLQGPQ